MSHYQDLYDFGEIGRYGDDHHFSGGHFYLKGTNLVAGGEETLYKSASATAVPPEVATALKAKDDAEKQAAAKAKAAEERTQRIANEQRLSGLSQNVFDPSIQKLPSRFGGNDMQLLFQKVSALTTPPKNEFETTVAYLQRTNANLKIAQAMGLKGRWTDKSCFATVWNDRADGRYPAVGYNADTQQMIVQLDRIGTRIGALPHDYGSSDFDTYNEYAGRLVMTEENISQFPHNYHEGWGNEYSGSSKYYTLKNFFIRMSPSMARQVKPNLRVLVLFRLFPKPLVNGTRSQLMANIRELWFFNFQTGQIYAKLKAKA